MKRVWQFPFNKWKLLLLADWLYTYGLTGCVCLGLLRGSEMQNYLWSENWMKSISSCSWYLMSVRLTRVSWALSPVMLLLDAIFKLTGQLLRHSFAEPRWSIGFPGCYVCARVCLYICARVLFSELEFLTGKCMWWGRERGNLPPPETSSAGTQITAAPSRGAAGGWPRPRVTARPQTHTSRNYPECRGLKYMCHV